MQNNNKKKCAETVRQVMSEMKVNKYLSSGQVAELNNLRQYKRDSLRMPWDSGDNWYQ